MLNHEGHEGFTEGAEKTFEPSVKTFVSFVVK